MLNVPNIVVSLFDVPGRDEHYERVGEGRDE